MVQTQAPQSSAGSVLRLLRTGGTKLVGFALGVLLLAVASVIALPEMVRASGPEAAAAIATGQAIGGIAGVLIAYSWGITGPVAIARGDRRRRLTVYGESLSVRLLLWLPTSLAAAALASLVARSDAPLAVLGAFSASTIGLTAAWYFVGLARPFVLLAVETVPRVIGIVVGIVLMKNGMSAAAALWGQFGGMIAGFAISSLWILFAEDRPSGWWRDRTPVPALLRSQFSGVLATSIPQLYAALPIIIVGFINPSVQPAFAIIDKFQKQSSAALFPIVTVLQGWVPRASGAQLRHRIRLSVLASAIGAALIVIVMAVVGQPVLTWLGAGLIPINDLAVVLSGVALGLALMSQVISRVCLVAIDKVGYVARISMIGAVGGIALIAILTQAWGVVGAVTGVAAGTAIKVLLGLLGLRQRPTAAAPVTEKVAEVERC